MTEKGPRKSGGFLSGEISGRLRDPHGAAPSEETDTDLKRALWRATAPRKTKELQNRNERLQAELDQLKKVVRGQVLSKKKEAPLKAFIRAVKSGNTNYSQAEIAMCVDRHLGHVKTSFLRVCPASWHRYQPPARFAEVFSPLTNPKLLKLAKSYIAKVRA